MNHCPMVLELLGSSIQSHSLARGKVNEKEAKVYFIVRGKNGEYLVTLLGHCVDDDLMVIHTLSLHKRGEIPANEYFIYKEGVLVSKVAEDIEENAEQILEEFSKDERI